MMRAFYALLPAVLVGALACLLHPVIGLAAAALMTGIGISATEAHPERGERQ